jgi:hypothetical protein
MDYKFLLFDGRARQDLDSAVVLELCDTLLEAVAALDEHPRFDPVIVRYEERGSKLLNPMLIPNPEHFEEFKKYLQIHGLTEQEFHSAFPSKLLLFKGRGR